MIEPSNRISRHESRTDLEVPLDRHQLAVENLTVTYVSSGQSVVAVRGVSFSVRSGQSLGIVGESGSGKSTTALAIMRLLPDKARVAGRVLLDHNDILQYSESEMRALRGRHMGMVFQDSLASLNPVFSVRSQLGDTIRQHSPDLNRKQAQSLAENLLEEVGISARRIDAYPHQFSGGMRQRVMMAAALAPGPSFLLADESTSDLDTVSQRQILDLLKQVSETRGLGMIVISHDLGVIHDLCDSLAVMYRGSIVESGETEKVLTAPEHPYTAALVTLSAREQDERGYLRSMPATSSEPGESYYLKGASS